MTWVVVTPKLRLAAYLIVCTLIFAAAKSLVLAAFSKCPASNPRQSISVVAEAPHEMLALGDACESDPMESEMMEYSSFLALSPGHVQEIEKRYV